MSSLYKLRSHLSKENRFQDGQLLADHLFNVSKIALETSKMHGVTSREIDKVIETICLCHDFGKSSVYFQKYLEGSYNGKLKNHGEISAYFAYYMLPEKWKMIGFMCVKKHHGNLEPDREFFSASSEEDIKLISKSIKSNIDELNLIYDQHIDEFFDLIENGSLIKTIKYSYSERSKTVRNLDKISILEEYIWIQYIWSLLLTSDKTQLIKGEPYQHKKEVFEDYVYRYKTMISEMFKENHNDSSILNLRNKVYSEAINKLMELDLSKNKVLSMTLPTGSGKTLATYGTSFKLFERMISEDNQIIPGIIYNIPFMSVIDQNFDVLKNIFKYNNIPIYDDFILKYHSMSLIEYMDSEEKEYQNYDARFCFDNWQSTIVTTTFAQLFNIIFKPGVNGIGHRFHKLAGSIIILDEVQAIPPKHYKIIEDILTILCERFNSYIITVTATKPLFLRGAELVSDNEEIYKSLSRITIENNMKSNISIDDFTSIVLNDMVNNDEKSFLIVLNTVNAAKKVFNNLKNQLSNKIIYYLTTEIYPKRRLEIIKQIKNTDQKVILISTQLIEAGVDLDFDIVYRDFAPIDSINQTAGRANRNGIKDQGIVKLYSLVNEHNKRFASLIYPISLLDISTKILKDRELIYENEMYSINQLYFNLVSEVTHNISNYEYQELLEQIRKLNFKNIRKSFNLIDDDYEKVDIIVNINEETKECIRVIDNASNENNDVINAWKKLNAYKIAIDKYKLKKITTYSIKDTLFLDGENYDEVEGIRYE